MAAFQVITEGLRAALVAAGGTLVLFVCPERDIDYSSETAHILTVALGALVLLIPMRVLLPVLVPYDTKDGQSDRVFFSTPHEWSPLIAGMVMSAFAFWSQSHKLGPYVHSKLISGLAGGVLIAYSFLAEPLGLRPKVGLEKL
jgi:peptidoglycan/LPS O-acetylase OafA/YrhL